jgi:hypothetical protein
MRPITAALPLFIVSVLALVVPTSATVIHVPGGAATIAEALGAASLGDTIMIASDTYHEHGLLMETPVTLMSDARDPRAVTIDGDNAGRVLAVDGADGAVIAGITFTNGISDFGGGVAVSSTDIVIQDCVFTGNHATWEGGGLYYGYADPTIVGCDFTLNTAANSGGGLVFHNAGGSVTDCWFMGNESQWGGGAAIYHDVGTTAFTECTFEENDAVGANSYGGGAYCWDYAKATFSHCEFWRNTSEYCGGAFSYDEFCEVDVTICLFGYNTGEFGGAIYSWEPVAASISDCSFFDNSADAGGGVLLENDEATLLVRCDFEGNTATAAGGGLTLEDCSVGPEDCLFYENEAGYGGAIAFEDCETPTVRGCTVVRNSSGGPLSGGGIAVAGNTVVEIENTIVAFSTAGEGVACEPGSSASATTCLVHGNADGDWVLCLTGQEGQSDNSGEDPRFCGMDQNNYSLCADSYGLPGNNLPGVQIGARGEGCDACGAPVEAASWGAIKGIFR